MVRGQLRVYVGAADGVGTTFAMLDEAIRRRSRGANVAVGTLRTHGRPATVAKAAELGERPTGDPAVLDVAAVLARGPDVVLVDDLAVDNPPGSPRPHRWQDVDALLDAGVDVVTTLTVQHIESLADPVRRIVGTTPSALVPDEFLARTDQFELIDIAPEAIRRRIAHGNVLGREADPAEGDLFNTDAFARLRVLLLLWLADHLSGETGIGTSGAEVRERVVVAVSGAPSGDAVVRRAARLAQRSRAALVGVHVHAPRRTTPPEVLARGRALVTELGGTFREVVSDDVASALLAVAEAEGATQLVLGTSGEHRRTQRSVVDQVVGRSPTVDVHVVSQPGVARSDRRAVLRLTPAPFSLRRRAAALVAGLLALALLTALFTASREETSVATSLGIYLLAVVAVSVLGGWIPGVVTAVAAPLLANWFLIEPYHTLRVADPENAVELVVFVSVALVVSTFVSVAARRSAEADQARREAASLARLAGSGGPDALAVVTEELCSTFGLDGVAVLRTAEGGSETIASSGPNPPDDPTHADIAEPLTDDTVLAARGRALTADEHRVLRVFLQQLSSAVEQHRVASLAAEADALARAEELRTGLLRAVSHDLRSPLAAVKAAVSSLRQEDVEWPADVRADFLASIEEETDRLNRIIGNLLDMSRLQAGAVTPMLRTVALEEVVPAALHSLGTRADTVDLAFDPDVPDVLVDPALLERVVANLAANAIAFSPSGERVRVTARAGDSCVHLYVIDHGPGIRPKDRSGVLQPFHRVSDMGRNDGVGLGLAIADGLTRAMNGTLELRDTPSGGLTVVVTVPRGATTSSAPAAEVAAAP